MNAELITLEQIYLSHNARLLLQDINLKIHTGENLLITGPAASGKTVLGRIIAGQLLPTQGQRILHTHNNIVYVNQQQDFRTAFSQRSYYQRRYEYNNDQDTPTVLQYLQQYYGQHAAATARLLHRFELEYILSRQLTQLSNGEGKRLQLLTAISLQPALIIIDNPYTGIDVHNRKLVNKILDELVHDGITYVLLSGSSEAPLSLKKNIHLQNGSMVPGSFSIATATADTAAIQQRFEKLMLHLPEHNHHFNIAAKLDDVSIQYDDTVILKNICWQVNKGECWLLRGDNGSGKSMLLSLLNGDNPKAFGKNIILFDKRKGSGESIWELKSKIGYVSPEMHIHFLRKPEHVAELVAKKAGSLDDPYQPKVTCRDVIASGFNEETGFVSAITATQAAAVQAWMEYLAIDKFADTLFYQIPFSLQRLCLLARALVRNPPLLILDEPCQGLDDAQTFLFKTTIEQLCRNFGNTIIYVSHYDKDVPVNISRQITLQQGGVQHISSAC
ncbi:MAG TPA: ATP-binding cassette domain-containing protein [Ferruginibacter sp.]|mgnify:CR=1 FL=1|nr:ATP-binding cassette domain-containing protein [Ferruginibacter sp.]HMP21335.1 ATP-binding cassette domain-containing protein [Ferruginibacter sp.]